MAHFAATLIAGMTLGGGVSSFAQTCCLDMQPAGPVQVHVNAFDFNTANTLNTLADAGLVKASNYVWWCVDVTTTHDNNIDDAPIFQNTLYSGATVYSSCDPGLTTYPPLTGAGLSNIGAVNYIINHKEGSYSDIQDAIWSFVGGPPAYNNPLSAATLGMIAGAIANPNYLPPCGSNMAVVIDFPDQLPVRDGGAAFPPGYESYAVTGGHIQRIIIEVPCICPPCEITVSVNSDKVCAGESATITASVLTGTGPFHYAWTVPAGAANPGDIASFSATVAGTYSVIVTSAECTAGNGSGNLTVNGKPTVSVTGDEICSGSSATITANVLTGTGPFHFAWTVPAGAANPGDTASFSATVAGTYSVIVSDANGCKGNNSGVLKVNTKPGVVVMAPETCVGTAAQVSATAGYTTYQWTVPAGAPAPGNTNKFMTTVGGLYKVVVTDSKGCKATNSATLKFNVCVDELKSGDTATIGFWQNKNGQALIKSLPKSPAFGNWLASNYPCLFGNLAKKSNDAVAAQFITYFNVSGQKTYAQVMAGAIAAYVTDSDLAGNNAAQYGFNVSSAGAGAKFYNVGSYGTAIGLQNNTYYTLLQLLKAANTKCPWNDTSFDALNVIFSGINQKGDI